MGYINQCDTILSQEHLLITYTKQDVKVEQETNRLMFYMHREKLLRPLDDNNYSYKMLFRYCNLKFTYKKSNFPVPDPKVAIFEQSLKHMKRNSCTQI